MMEWLLELLGLKQFATGAKWVVRLGILMVRLVLLGGLAIWLFFTDRGQEFAVVLAVLALAFAVFRWWWRNRHRETSAGERTIDGKTVPDKLAAAALAIPAQSPDADYVLRGLPDYGKTLLKLDVRQFEYRPETPQEDIPEPESPLEEPAPRRSWTFPDIRRPALATGIVALVMVALVGIKSSLIAPGFIDLSPLIAPAAVVMLALALAAFRWQWRNQQGPTNVERAPKRVSHLTAARVAVMIWLRTIPRWAKVAGAAALVAVVGVSGMMISTARREGQRQKESAAFDAMLDAETRRAEQTLKPAPPPEASAAPNAIAQIDTGKAPPELLPGHMRSAAPASPEPQSQTLQEFLAEGKEFRQDPETGQKWTLKDNGPKPIKDYDAAVRYCKSLDVGGLTGWRLPSINELSKLSNLRKKFGDSGSGNFELSQPQEILWSSTLSADGVQHEGLPIGEIPAGADPHGFTHALCVHD